MRALSITNGAQLRERSSDFLLRHFGKIGIFYNFARGMDDRPVEPSRIRKSVGCEETYRADVTRAEALEQHLPLLVEELTGRLARSGFRGNTLTLKVKFPDFVQKSRCMTVPDSLTEKEDILPLARTLMEDLIPGTARSAFWAVRLPPPGRTAARNLGAALAGFRVLILPQTPIFLVFPSP